MMKIRKYSVEEWEVITGDSAENGEIAFYAYAEGDEPVGCYCGAMMQDGTFSVYGCGEEHNRMSYDEMIEAIGYGI